MTGAWGWRFAWITVLIFKEETEKEGSVIMDGWQQCDCFSGSEATTKYVGNKLRDKITTVVHKLNWSGPRRPLLPVPNRHLNVTGVCNSENKDHRWFFVWCLNWLFVNSAMHRVSKIAQNTLSRWITTYSRTLFSQFSINVLFVVKFMSKDTNNFWPQTRGLIVSISGIMHSYAPSKIYKLMLMLTYSVNFIIKFFTYVYNTSNITNSCLC